MNVQILSRSLATLTLAFVFFGVFFASLPVLAQKPGIESYGRDKTNPEEKGWFIYKVKPGSVIEDFALLTNDHPKETTVELNANDATVTSNGDFTLVNNEIEDKLVGSWVKLEQNIYTIPGEKGLKVPFKIEVPSDAKSGEYAGGLSIIEVADNNTSNSPLSTKIRLGARIYITIEGDLNLTSNISDLVVINPSLTNFKQELEKRGFIDVNALTVKFIAENTGNVYGVIKGELVIINPDGQRQTQTFGRDLIAANPNKEIYIRTNSEYKVGTTKVELNYQIEPLNLESSEVNTEPTSGSLSYEFNLTKEDLGLFTSIRKSLAEDRGTVINSSSSSGPSFTIQAANTDDKKEDNDESNDKNIYYFAGVIIVLLLVLIVVVLTKKTPKTAAEDKVSESESSKTDRQVSEIGTDKVEKKAGSKKSLVKGKVKGKKK